jgi:pimeloyl-ACP methyl ester carboxylesterase
MLSAPTMPGPRTTDAAELDWTAYRVGGIAVTARRRRPGCPDVALFHGALGDSRRIAPIAPLLDDCNLALFDMRGHGRSHRPAHGYDVDELAIEMLAPLAAAFGDSRFAILAESFSGVVALAIAVRLPAVQRLVLVDTPFDTARMQASHAALVSAYARATQAERPSLEALCDSFFGLDVRSGAVTIRRFHHHLATRRAPTTMITGSRKASREPDAAEPAAYFDAADLAALNQAHPSVPLDVVEIAGGGHRLMKTHLPQVAAVLRSAIAGTTAS